MEEKSFFEPIRREAGCHWPASLGETLELLGRYGGKARLVAGGTDLAVEYKMRVVQPEHLIYLGGVPGLDYIKKEEDLLRIGALATHQALADSALVKREAAALAQACDTVAGPAIRNVGTIGGNIVNASPANDGAVALVGLGADAKLASKRGERTVPLRDFFLGPHKTVLAEDEVLTEVTVPLRGARRGSQFMKIGRRADMSISVVCAAVSLALGTGGAVEDAIIAIGSAAPRPLRAVKAEGLLRGKMADAADIEAVAAQAAEETSPIDDGFGRAWYRKEMAGVLVRRGLEAALGAARARP